MYSKLILNGTIVDGTGAAPYVGDIAIEQDTIVQVGKLKGAKAQQVIDASGKYVTPGFIDIQNHSDVYWTLFDNPASDSLVAQGITTALIGNCGASLAPILSPDALLSIQKWHNLAGINFNWSSFAEFIEELSGRRFGVNFASLVGYSTIRRGLVKNEIRDLEPIEMRTIVQTIGESIEAGAFGLSSGLSYTHESVIKRAELDAIASVVKDLGGLFSVHVRSEGQGIVESVQEAADLATRLGVNIKISHLKVRDKENWPFLKGALDAIEIAYQKTGNVFFDVYPYDFVWEVLYPYLPKWAYEGGREMMLARLKDREQRSKILDYLATKKDNYSSMYIASTNMSLNVTGRTIGAIAARQNVSSEEALLNILENGGSDILVFDKNLDMEQVKLLAAHPLSMIATDGAGFSVTTKDNLVHPRCFGSMPRFLELALGDGQLPVQLPIELAIKKITATPAQRIGLQKRGKVAVDYFADLVIFTSGIRSSANETNPYQYPHGIEHVLVNGEFSVKDGELQKKLSGKVLKRI